MRKIILFLILLILVISCTKQIEKPAEEKEQQLLNPASVYCQEQGGTLRIEENEAGQYGICTLADGTECEEWAYYRRECPKQEVEEKAIEQKGEEVEEPEETQTNWPTFHGDSARTGFSNSKAP